MDLLRGIAVLGIFWVNIVYFALPYGAYHFPSLLGDAVALNNTTWLVSELLIEGSMRTLFTLLFARSLCKRGFRIKRFFLCFVLGTLIFGAMFSLIWMMLMSALMNDLPPVLLMLAFMLTMSGAHLALVTPFLTLMFYNSFWRARFFGMLSLSQALNS